MKKFLLVSLCLLSVFMTQVYAQNRTVTGTVTEKDDGLPIPGVSVKVKGTSVGTQTTASGKFVISVPTGGVLVFSYIGFSSVERSLTPTGVIDVQLETAANQLGEVVINGTEGRKLTEKSVGYSQTHLTAEQVNLSGETNLLTGLTGKVAGLQVNTTGSGVDPGIRVVLRGNRSINGNNQALIVVDGAPLPGGDISSIDPSTIESQDILNGGLAGALYGAEASNGVIVITTKKGAPGGKPTITYTNSFLATQAYYFPKYQTQFGQYGGEGAPYINPLTGGTLYVPYENQQYGPAFDGSTVQLGPRADGPTGPINYVTYAAQKKDPRKAFYNLGLEDQNLIKIASGNGDDYFNFEAQNVYKTGIVPMDKSVKNSVTFKSGKKYGIFKADFSVTYTNTSLSQASNSPGYGGTFQNALAQWPANVNIKDFQDPTSTFANPSNFFDSYAVNPYWIINNARTNTTRQVILGNINLGLTPTKWLDINYRLSDNQGFLESKFTEAQVNFNAYSITDPLGSGNIPSTHPTGVIPGQVADNTSTGDGNNGYSRFQQDAIINIHPVVLKDFKFNLLLGATMTNQHAKFNSISATALLVQGLYNVAYNAGSPTASESEATINTLGYYSNLDANYKNWAFITVSLRNDHDSRLSAANRSYFYPGISGSFVFTDAIPALKGSKIINYGKLRGGYAITGQVNVGAYNINDVYGVTSPGFPYGAIGGLSVGGTHYTAIVPERVTEIEFGTELAFFDNYLHGTVTYFKQNSRNQTLGIGTSASTGFTSIVTNVGELQSSGVESSLTISPFKKSKNGFGLDIGGNFTNYESKVVSLLGNVPQFNISGGAGNEYAIVGQPYPVLKGTDFLKDAQGRTMINPANGYPLLNPTPQILGRTTPEYIFGAQIDASYKFMSLHIVADYRTGFVTDFSQASTLIFGGTSAYTTVYDRQRFVYPNSSYTNAAGAIVANTNIPVADGNYGFYQNSNFNTANSPYISSAAAWKLREVALTFDLSQFTKKFKYMKGAKFSLQGRNLLEWVPKTNYWGDPELSVDSSNSTGFQNINNLPAQRYFGAKLDLTF